VDAIALPLDQGHVGVVGQLVEQGGDRGGVREDGVPVSEGEIGGEKDRSRTDIADTWPLVAAVDHLVEQVGGMGVVGQVAHLVDLCGAPHKSTHVEYPVMWSAKLESA
jgi:hypothetical protein